jgi:hypothetical protein
MLEFLHDVEERLFFCGRIEIILLSIEDAHIKVFFIPKLLQNI